ncbi:MAG TPA: polysaccharide deacetylase [Ruminococcaceae bacterium]|jgi:peptidoglycan-N-acetylmuramic acid deacetylase|nr:polysaccharide deacetylase [Oscillospiraceae bacterium]
MKEIIAAVLAASMSVSASEYSRFESIDNTKVAYGMGVDVDSMNRPLGAIQAQEQYGDMGGLFIGDSTNKQIWLTFDEGYENGCTAGILDTLKEKNVRAVFFVTYDYCKRNPELVKRMIAEGHTVGNHTWSHPSLPECSPDELYSELSLLHEYVRDEFGYDMYVMRPPKGEFSQRVLACAKELGYTTVLWSFAYPDWDVNNQPDPEQAFQKITGKSHNGAVYLLHAVSETNAAILGRVIDYWRDNGFVITPM